MKRKTMRGGVSPSSAAESPCRPSCSEPRARTVARMVCGTPSTNSPAEACALAVPVAQISPQLWAETHCLGNRGTQHISLLRLDSSVNRYGRPAWIRGKYPVNKYLNLCAHAYQPVGPGPDKNEKEKGIGKSAQRSTFRFATKTQPRELKKRIVDFPGFGLSSTAPNLEKSQHPVRCLLPTRTLRTFDRDPGGAGRETRPGGSPLDRRRHRAR